MYKDTFWSFGPASFASHARGKGDCVQKGRWQWWYLSASLQVSEEGGCSCQLLDARGSGAHAVLHVFPDFAAVLAEVSVGNLTKSAGMSQEVQKMYQDVKSLAMA